MSIRVYNIIPLLTILVSSGFCQVPVGFESSPRQKLSINSQWRFHLGDPDAEYYSPKLDDTDWEMVTIPHTLELTSLTLDDYQDDKTQETFHRKAGWYRRQLFCENSDRRFFLEFEGAHQVTTLWVNGRLVGQHEISGYTPFHFEITEYIEKGRNQVTLLVDNRKRTDVPPDPGPFDYIKFSGLYRDVYLVKTGPVRIPFNWEGFETGVTFTTPSVDPVNGNATVQLKTGVENQSGEEKRITVVNRLIDHTGQVVLKLAETRSIPAKGSASFNQIGGIEDNLELWSVESPYLYRLNTLIYDGNTALDGVECKVGIRKFEHHPREGFLLNGHPIKLIGMNRHQHFPYIGDAVPDNLHRKDMLQLKQLGFNVVRTAHYPQDDALLEACDELGLLVYEEPPTWIAIGNEAWFDNLEKASRVMVRNHRNHPSVVIWGAGINHRGPVPRMHYAIKQEDPTRLTASQGSRWTGWQTSGLTDIYGQMIYGPVEWKRHEPMLAMEGRDGILDLAPYKLDPLLTGIIAWTAHDYYTFHPSPDHDRVRNAGIMTIFRQPYSETHFYPIELTDHPSLHIASEWEEDTEEVVVYSNAEEVALFVNGKLLDRKGPRRTGLMSAFDHPPIHFAVDRYEAGRLTAKGYENGRLLLEKTIHTPGRPTSLALEIDTLDNPFVADGSSIILAYAHVVDKNGTKIKAARHQVQFSVEGPAVIVGDGVDIGANPIGTDQGTAPLLIRSTSTAGTVKLTASAEGLTPANASWSSTPWDPDLNLNAFAPFHDVDELRVDLGAPDQLLQFDWTPWNADREAGAAVEFPALGGFRARVRPQTESGYLRWLGEMNVMGKYGYALGEGVISVGGEGMALELEGLPQGKYRITTYHHAPRANTDSMDPNREKLKTVKPNDIPYAKTFAVELHTADHKLKRFIRISEGRILPETGPGQCSFTFSIADDGPVKLQFSPVTGSGENIWLNAFILQKLVF